ncbi:MAG: BrnA antitoxin family protein [Candidatus Rokuibacteriota bacterium]
MAKPSASSARAGRAGRSARPTRRRRIEFSDIPEASAAQLRAMRRVGRPPLGIAARRLIAIRIDPQVLEAVRQEARRRGLGYQSLINDLLAKHVARTRTA